MTRLPSGKRPRRSVARGGCWSARRASASLTEALYTPLMLARRAVVVVYPVATPFAGADEQRDVFFSGPDLPQRRGTEKMRTTVWLSEPK